MNLVVGLVYIAVFNFIIKSIVNTRYLKLKTVDVRYLIGYTGTLIFAIAFYYFFKNYFYRYFTLDVIVYAGLVVAIATVIYALVLTLLRLSNKMKAYDFLVRPIQDSK